MTIDIRICQFLVLTTSTGDIHQYQNYFANQPIVYGGKRYEFAPFRAEGSISSLNGDNSLLQVLFPNIELIVRLLDAGNGNRLSTLVLTTQWLTNTDAFTPNVQIEYYVGVGASLNETTVELRFRSAIDSVSSNFPARTLTRELVGPLPLDSQLYLQ
jgi:hypothetical protein